MLYLLTMIFLLILAPPALAVTALSMEEAEKLFLANNLEIKTKKLSIQKTEAGIVEAKTLPNPSLKYSVATLQNGQSEKEEVFSVTQTLDLSGRRGREIEAALAHKEAGVFFLEQDIAGLLSQMKQMYCRIMHLKANEQALTDLKQMFSLVEEKMELRVKAGDASPADQIKISAEKGKTVRGLETLRMNLRAEKRKLAFWINHPQDETDVSDRFIFQPVVFNLQELTERRLADRPDLKGQGRAVSASGLLLEAALKKRFPPLDLEVGYKKWIGGFDGLVFGISVPLPLFNRNQAGISRAQAELEQSKLSLEALKKTAHQEAQLLAEQIAHLEVRVQDLTRQVETARKLTKIAGLAYEEGETGVLDLLEAVRTEKEAVLEYNQAVYEHWFSILEMEKILGTKLTNKGGAQ